MILKMELHIDPVSAGYPDDQAMVMNCSGFDDSVIRKGFEDIGVKVEVVGETLMTDEEADRSHNT